jgi:hypothetical protein
MRHPSNQPGTPRVTSRVPYASGRFALRMPNGLPHGATLDELRQHLETHVRPVIIKALREGMNDDGCDDSVPWFDIESLEWTSS